ncbi:L7/L12-related protein [Prevotella sp. OH937_COT-195]|uniref:L7/L12-related protein n=1 Tax=Prevotella sp. OH937_COT-195 TaxID=2491051 RepID=UPI000F6545EF|nr:L7/L12-related protein [Prevotella sp. OH937_COT-195]RRD00288.1 hypothetical protein EII32_07220 [Prevotella sp. OH937_COT-195]
MKKKNLLLAGLAAMAALWTTDANAQTEYKYSFEGDVIADGWRVETTNNSQTWVQWGTKKFNDVTVVPHDGEKQMWLGWSWNKQDERLVSPAIKLGSNATLTFWNFIPDYDAEKGSRYNVEISTDNGETWTKLWNVTEENKYENAITVDLGAYAGKNVNISWRAYDGNGTGLEYTWLIDNVTVSNIKPAYDVVLESCKDNKLPVIKVLREKLGIGLKEAKDFVESAPCILKKLTTMYDAKDFVDAINNAGGLAKMAPAGMYDPEFISLFESFEEDAMPEGWTTEDEDNDGETWKIINGTELYWLFPLSGDKVIGSWSWNNKELDPNNYLISPLLSDAAELNYRFAMNTKYPDHYQVLASTTGNDVADFTKVLIDEKPEGLVKIGGSDTQSIWYERTLPLPAGTKHVAFRHCNSKDNNYILLDNIRIIKGIATGIETVTTDDKTVARKGIYNINGMKTDGEWENLPKGVYVVDGKKKVKN